MSDLYKRTITERCECGNAVEIPIDEWMNLTGTDLYYRVVILCGHYIEGMGE